MLRDLFFYIWYDNAGLGWISFTTTLFLLCLAWIIYKVARTKALDKKLSKKTWIGIFLASFLMYQIVPVTFQLLAIRTMFERENVQKSDIISSEFEKEIKYRKLAIKTALIPWQKGAYYYDMGQSYRGYISKSKGFASVTSKDVIYCYEKAYKYVKSYKYPALGGGLAVAIEYYNNGDYDKAIEVSKIAYSKSPLFEAPFPKEPEPLYGLMAKSYLMKGDLENALLNINLEVSDKSSWRYLALKAYLEKKIGDKKLAYEYYKKGLKDIKCGDECVKEFEAMYEDYYAYEQKRLNDMRDRRN